jgi:hypothetical protein
VGLGDLAAAGEEVFAQPERDMDKPEARLKITTRLMRDLVRIAERKQAA